MSNEKYTYKIVPSVKTSAPVSPEKMEELMDCAERTRGWLIEALPESVYDLGGGPVVTPVITGHIWDIELHLDGIEVTMEFKLVRELVPVTYKLVAEIVHNNEVIGIGDRTRDLVSNKLNEFLISNPEFQSQEFLCRMHKECFRLSRPIKMREFHPAHFIYRVEECK